MASRIPFRQLRVIGRKAQFRARLSALRARRGKFSGPD